MAKKIVKVEDTKASNSKLDLGKLAKTIMENGEAIEKITDGIGEIINNQNGSKKTSKSTKKTTTKKKPSTKSSNTDSLSKVIDIAEVLLKK